MPDPNESPYTPHFVIGESNDPATVEVLQELETAIYEDPKAVLHKVETLDIDALNTEASEDTLAKQIAVATGKEADLGFDELTEGAVATSGVMVELRLKRKENQRNETMATALAAEVRRTRLALFLQRVIEMKDSSAAVVALPERSRRARKTSRNLSA